jgi:uncharacterized protein (TIGR00730 family)
MLRTMPKTLCVYCASSDRLDPKYYALAETLGSLIAAGGHSLVYGGGKVGMMGAVARSVKAGGGRVIGVIPEFMIAKELEFTGADELIRVHTMRERKRLMEERADAFITLPGGWGTLEEILEIITLRQLDVVRKPCVFVNHDGFYNELFRFFGKMVDQQFNRPSNLGLFSVASDAREALEHALSEQPTQAESKWFETR